MIANCKVFSKHTYYNHYTHMCKPYVGATKNSMHVKMLETNYLATQLLWY